MNGVIPLAAKRRLSKLKKSEVVEIAHNGTPEEREAAIFHLKMVYGEDFEKKNG